MHNGFALIGLLVALSPCGAAAADAPSSAANLAVTGSIPGPDGDWDYVAIDGGGRRLYVAHGSAVMTVDLDSGKVNPKLVEGQRLHAVIPVPDGRALSTNGGSNTATLFEGATGKIIATVPTGRKPDAAVFDPSTGFVFVMGTKDGDATLIDTKTGKSPGRISIGGSLESGVADGKGRIYVNIEDRDGMVVIDSDARKVVARYKLPDCREPSGVALDPATNILVSACSNRKALAIDAKDGRVIASLAIGQEPDTVIFDPARKLFFIPCGDGTLAVIDGRTAVPMVIATIPTAKGARTGALDPKTGNLYLPTADPQKAPEGGHAGVVPGTFRILIVGTRK